MKHRASDMQEVIPRARTEDHVHSRRQVLDSRGAHDEAKAGTGPPLKEPTSVKTYKRSLACHVVAWMGGEFGKNGYTSICMAKSLCCWPKAIITSLIGYTPIQNTKVLKKERGALCPVMEAPCEGRGRGQMYRFRLDPRGQWQDGIAPWSSGILDMYK